MSYDGNMVKEITSDEVSIPLEQGNVLRPKKAAQNAKEELSQSLWNRAMSYDSINGKYTWILLKSQSLWNRAMSYDL